MKRPEPEIRVRVIGTEAQRAECTRRVVEILMRRWAEEEAERDAVATEAPRDEQ